jgi:hypothetical protein
MIEVCEYMEASMSVPAKHDEAAEKPKLFADYVSDRVFEGVRVVTDPQLAARLARLGREALAAARSAAKQKSDAK